MRFAVFLLICEARWPLHIPTETRLTWLTTYKDEISGTAAIAGVLVGVFGFGLTICQIRNAATALKATNGYQIQKDAREITEKLAGDQTFRAAIKSGVTPGDKEIVEDDLWKIFNFYLAVFRQQESGGITDEFAKSYSRDFCDMFASASGTFISAEWKQMLSDQKLNNNHESMKKKWCENA